MSGSLLLPAVLGQLSRARLRGTAVVTYLALLEQLDWSEYRPVVVLPIGQVTGLSPSCVADSLLTLTRAGFLDRRTGTAPFRYRLLQSQRRAISVTVDSDG